MARLSRLIAGMAAEEAGYGYVNVPKAACSSIKEAILRHRGIPESQHKGLLPWMCRFNYIAARRDLTWFSFVRHPCDRLVSLWADILVPPYPEGVLRLNPDLQLMCGWPFDRFAWRVCKIDPWRSNFHFLPQVDLLRYEGRWLADEVYRFEELADAWSELQRRFGLPDLSHHRKTSHPPWQEMYSEELMRLVHRRYHEDFDLWYKD